ncbi:WO male-killing family protein Wmk [Wolbachia endosymbiont (group A) of Epistrophe grossularia]|uniref:WO male-killing family protein Wmk n=1 Tax=Wolbachia endosymbiont (group A) of Epistrophe grossularia TaxID=2954008 RepID=UPI00222E73B5|nr:helix-turn-helix transcriptional regulator [Wolbachia endosymbiont (group A) of Epistrophe grossularia]
MAKRTTISIRYEIAQNVRSWILKRKYTQKDLANKTGIEYYTLLRYVKGKCGIPTEKLKRIAKALSVPISNLLPPPREDSCFDKDKAQETYDFMGKYMKTKGRGPRKAINALTKFIRAQEESDVKAARIRMAKNMLELEFDADIIYQATGLSIDEYDNKELVVCKRHKEGQEMKKWRIIREYTQEELAKELGVAHSQIHNYEQGKSTFLSEMACKVAEILSVDDKDLITEEDYYEDEEAENELLSLTREFKRIDNQESRDKLNILIGFLSQRKQIYKEKIDKAEGIKVANNLLILGISVDAISSITGLSSENQS